MVISLWDLVDAVGAEADSTPGLVATVEHVLHHRKARRADGRRLGLFGDASPAGERAYPRREPTPASRSESETRC